MLSATLPHAVLAPCKPRAAAFRVSAGSVRPCRSRRSVLVKAEADSKATGKQLAAEFVGCALFQLVGGAAPAAAAPFANGLGLSALIYAFGGVSGAHFNPAVTVMLLLKGRVGFEKAIAYIAAQVAGCVLGALICTWIIPGVAAGVGAGPGTWAPAAALGTGAILGWEALLTAFLCLVVYGSAVIGTGGVAAPLGIGLAVMAAVMTGGDLSGAVINPARALGPAIVFGMNMGVVMTYICGQLAGAALAAGLTGMIFDS